MHSLDCRSVDQGHAGLILLVRLVEAAVLCAHGAVVDGHGDWIEQHDSGYCSWVAFKDVIICDLCCKCRTCGSAGDQNLLWTATKALSLGFGILHSFDACSYDRIESDAGLGAIDPTCQWIVNAENDAWHAFGKDAALPISEASD